MLALPCAVFLTTLGTLALAKILKMLKIYGSLGPLTGGATAICGASAALAIACGLPKCPLLARDTALTLVGVTTLSTLAMMTCPLLAHWLGFDALASGRFIGATFTMLDKSSGRATAFLRQQVMPPRSPN